MKKGTKLDPKTPRAMKYRLRQLLEAGNSSHQAAMRLGVTDREVLALLGEMQKDAGLRADAATVPTTIDPAFTKPRNSDGAYVKTTVSTDRTHATPVYRRTCEDALALLNLETMSTESRIRLASQLISETLRRWNTDHTHRFVTDDDGVVHPCACGAKWSPTPGRST